MTCPYCFGSMEPLKTISYRVPDGLVMASWVRCIRCDHKSVAETRAGEKRPADPPLERCA